MNHIPSLTISRRGLLGGAAASLLLAGCSDTATDSGAAGGGSSMAIGMPTDILLATVLRFHANNQPIRRNVFEYVVDRKPSGGYAPYLGTKWTWADDHRKLVIDLRDDVTFHSGRAFGPDDVIASIKATQDPESGAQSGKLLALATSVEKSGDHQLTATFDQPSAVFLDGLAMLPIIDSETFPQIAEGKQVIGTGPYRFSSWKPGSSLTLEAYDDYWRQDRPRVQSLQFNVIGDPQALLAALRSGDIDLAMRMIARDGASLKSDSRFTVDTTVGYEVYLGANTTVKPLDDVRVRQAIAYALDRDRICKQVYSGYATPSCVPWTEGTPGVSDSQRSHYNLDVDKAKALIDQAGAAGAEIALSSLAAEPTTGAVLQVVQYNLEQLGLKPRVVTFDDAEFATVLQAGKFPGMWVTDVALTAMGPATAMLTANPLTPAQNTENFTPQKYADLTDDLVAAVGAGEDGATQVSALSDYFLDQAFHISLAQIKTLITHASTVSGVTSDLTLAPDFSGVEVSS